MGKGRVATTRTRLLEDVRVGIRLKISVLWITMLFLFAYGDIFGFFAPGSIEEIVSGEVSGIEITQGFLLAISVYIGIASAMVFLTLVLSPNAAIDERRARGPVHRLDRRSGDRRVGVLPVPQRGGDRGSDPHRLVRVDVAAGGEFSCLIRGCC